MFKNTALAHAVNKKVQHLYGDFGAAAIRDGFDGNSIFYAMIISNIIIHSDDNIFFYLN